MMRQQLVGAPVAFIAGPFANRVLRNCIETALVRENVRVVQLADGTPRTTAPPDTCKAKLREVDFTVICLGQHPGSFLPDSDHETYTGLEIRGSILLDLPVVAMLMDDDARISFGSTVKTGASAEVLQRQRRIIAAFFSPSYFRTGTDVEQQVARAVREWVHEQISERQAIKRIQTAHMANAPTQSNSYLHDTFSCTIEIKHPPVPIAPADAHALGLLPSYLECFGSVSGLGSDWIYLSDEVWSRVAARGNAFPLLVRGNTRCVGRHSQRGDYVEIGGFAMEELIASC